MTTRLFLCSSSRKRAARSCASSNTWTSAARTTGRCPRWSRGRKCWRLWPRIIGSAEPIRETSSAPADRYRLPDGTTFGIIASTTEPFCRSCDRSRLTADGVWYLCLYAARGVDLRGPLRGGVSDEALRDLITSVWHARTDRGAENRLSTAGSIAADSVEGAEARPTPGDAHERRMRQSAVESRQLRAFNQQLAVQSAVGRFYRRFCLPSAKRLSIFVMIVE